MTQVRWSLFESWTPERAWWFGAFLGDGCNHRPKRGGGYVSLVGAHTTVTRWFTLVSPDSLRLREALNSPGTFTVRVNAKALTDWMERTHGYCGPKSEKLAWPEDLPNDLKVHFLRGLWDTDGCLSIGDRQAQGRTGNPVPLAVYTSKALPFLERIRAELHGLVGTSATQAIHANKQKVGQLGYGSSQAMKVADFLYAGAPEHLRNEDRMEVYGRLCTIREAILAPCACGNPETYCDGDCRACWEARRAKKTGPSVLCEKGCGRAVVASGLCDICRKRDRRAQGNYKTPCGTCPCGEAAYRSDPTDTARKLCEACYSRRRRGVPTRFELPKPARGWSVRAGAKLPGRPRADRVVL